MAESYLKGQKTLWGKGEIARYEQFLLFPQCFQKACFPGASRGVIVLEWVNAVFNSISVISRWPVHLSMLSWSYSNTLFFPSHWLLSHITIFETRDSGERGMNPVAMTIINPRKEDWPSMGSPVLKSATLSTEQWGSIQPDLEKQ